MKRNKGLQKALSGLLGFSLALSLVFPGLGGAGLERVEASEAGTADVKDINLNIGGDIAGITDPTPPVSASNDPWKGSKVYFGSYDQDKIKDGTEPVLFRVLDAQTTDYSSDQTTETMFLDCDSVLEMVKFNLDATVNPGDPNPNKWEFSYSIFPQGNAA